MNYTSLFDKGDNVYIVKLNLVIDTLNNKLKNSVSIVPKTISKVIINDTGAETSYSYALEGEIGIFSQDFIFGSIVDAKTYLKSQLTVMDSLIDSL